MFNENQFSLDLGGDIQTEEIFIEFKDIIIDRKSKYTSAGGKVTSKEEVKQFIHNLHQDKYYRKSTHNSFAYRLKSENGSVVEGKNDDGETGAGMCILREMQRENCINMIIVITRYFGGIHLQSDRFKNVIDGSKYFINEIKKGN